MSDWPACTVAVQPWLSGRGINRKLADAYRKSGWVDRVGHGAYIRAGAAVDWTGCLQAVQVQLGLSVHAGGRTALELQGYAHFLPMGKRHVVFLFGTPKDRLPVWFVKKDWGARVHFTTTNLFRSEKKIGLTSRPTGAFALTVSAPERAIMEVLHLTPQVHSMDAAKLLMEGLTTLRPTLVQTLLKTCRSIKVKRIFLFLADECGHAWARKLDLTRVNLGMGKRVIGKGGRFVSKFNISVPASLRGPKTPGEAR